MNRRSFFKMLSFGSMILAGPLGLMAGFWEKGEKNYWENGIFRQKSIDISNIESGIIRARIDNSWLEYSIKKLPSDFMEWNLGSRLKALKAMREGTGGFTLGGPHSGMVATCGGKRKDSVFTLNNAVKGIGMAPASGKVDSFIEHMVSHGNDDMRDKLDWLIELYGNHENFDPRMQTSLELYTSRDFETHTFLNIMENPAATIVFLDRQSFEVRSIARIVHPGDNTADEYEKKLLKYVNRIHGFFHGEFSIEFPLLIFYAVEVFDNTPGNKKGVRIMPPLL